MRLITLSLMLAAGPAMAASGPFVSLSNTNFIVLIAFLVFVGILLYAKVPAMLTGLLDKRAQTIRAELDEAKALREEAQSILAQYERKQKDVHAQADRIVTAARDEAMAAAAQARVELSQTIARRMAAAEEQIKAAEIAAVREVRDRAIAVAVAAAGDVLARQMTPEGAAAMNDTAIGQVEARLH
ncbi:MAG: F0F1 ATP synthase subunit B [Rhodobacterales bacterium]|nr:F0F1 ATP synthase subunit B [Rhodobacterales bacterium]